MVSHSEIIKALRSSQAGARIADAPDRLDKLERKVAALERKALAAATATAAPAPAPAQPAAGVCPDCSTPALQVAKVYRCSECGHTETRTD